MKMRSDFVSNSSSSSFVMWNETGDAKLLIEKLAEMFADMSMPWDIDETLRIYVTATNKWYADVANALLDKEDAKKSISDHDGYLNDYCGGKHHVNEDDVSYDNIEFPFSSFAEKYDALLSVADKIYALYFSTQDECDQHSLSELKKMYVFCRDIDCNPDMSVTERDFLRRSEDDNVLYKTMEKVHKLKEMK